MNDAKEYIKSKHNGEIPYKYGADECARLMESYAKHYHEREVKNLRLGGVVGQSEQLCDCDKPNRYYCLKTGGYRCRKCKTLL